MLATGWEWNDDGTELRLTLRDDVTFDDGTRFDADAVVANMERFAEGGGGNAAWMAGVSVEAEDPYAVVITLEAPDPAFLFYLSDALGLMANPNAFDNVDSLATTPDGTGPYRLDASRTTIGTTWAYQRADEYWGEQLPFDTITMSVFDNETAIVNGLRTRQLDAAVIQDANQQATVMAEPSLHTEEYEFDFQGIVLLDRGGSITPELGDERVRQAINYAIDRETMVEQIRLGTGTPTAQIFGVETEGFRADLDTYYNHDPQRARELLAEAGLADGFELKLPLTTSIVSDAIAASLQADLAAINIELTWVDVDQGDALRRILHDHEFPGFVMNLGQPANDWLTVKDLVLPGTFNVLGYSDAETEHLVPELQATAPGEAGAVAGQLNKHLVQAAWYVPFYRMTYLVVTTEGVAVELQSGMAVPSIYNYEPVE
jgi:peptide/nickel transport system substrate-binding protein